MPSCSKAPRGLFVLSWVTSIFTRTSISPGPSLRQRPDRYTIRAGRNLPDKEFRYLRTVIVTAAVHRGFGSELVTPPLNLPALGRCQPVYVGSRLLHGPVFLLNSRLGLLAATPQAKLPSSRKTLHPPGHPFSRSYGVSLPSSLTRVLPSALRFLPPPTCVGLRYGQPAASTRAFLGSSGSVGSPLGCPASSRSPLRRKSPRHPTGFDAASPTPRSTYLHASPGFLALNAFTTDRYRNINLLSIAYGYYALGLGPTNPTRIHLPSETLGLRRTRFSRAFSLLIPAFSLRAGSRAPHGFTFITTERSPTPALARSPPSCEDRS